VYSLSEEEKRRLKDGIQAAYAIPFIHDITDFIWEAVFSYTKKIPVVDPMVNTRKKLLYDVVDEKTKTGWSAKAIQVSLQLPASYDLVIQRADIFKKGTRLGYGELNKNSSPEILGEALLLHWYSKVENDAVVQKVSSGRVCILLKTRNRRRYGYFEEELARYSASELSWHWTDGTKTGLQGVRKKDGEVVFRWYPNQKQLFERFPLSAKIFTFELRPLRLPSDEVVRLLLKSLNIQ